MRPTGKEASMNKAAAAEPKSGHHKPASGGPGPEKKANMSGAFGSGNGSGGLKGAINELKTQHPIKHDDHGPHHGGTDHIRHKPMKLS